MERHLTAGEFDRRWRETLRGYARKHVAPFIGECPIGSLDAATLDSYYAELRRCRDHCDGRATVVHATIGEHGCDQRCRPHVCRPSSAGTIRHIHYMISGAYESAIRWEWIAFNPMRRARKPAPPRPDPQPPTAEEAAALVNESWRRGLGPLVWVAMTTGARRGELCALRWRDLLVSHAVQGEHDCEACGCKWTLVIRRAIAEAHDGTLWETDTKAHQRRHVALDPETVAVLLDHRQQCEQLATRLGTTRSNDHFMFARTPDGTLCSKPSLVTRRYERCAARLKIKTTLHRLRHYSATELITAGVDVRTVAGRLGHRDANTTLKVYAAWVSAADQHASTVLMQRVPQRPAPPVQITDPAMRNPTSPYECVAATLYTAWESGTLTVGTELTVKSIAAAHDISIGTSHRVISLLDQWGVLQVCTGRPSTVRAPSGRSTRMVVPAPASAAQTGSVTQAEGQSDLPRAATKADSSAESTRRVLTLELVHLGTTIRTLRTHANPDDFAALQHLMLNAIRRAGGDHTEPGDYEMAVYLAGHEPEVFTTVVIAA